MHKLLWLLLLAPSCAYVSASDQDARLAEFDLDADGFADVLAGGTDCDDDDPDVFPGAAESCDGVDQDCDGVVDDGLMVIRFVDADGDGFGDLNQPVLACADDGATAQDGTDCDDSNEQVNPQAQELCDGLDDDCNGLIDDDAGELVYRDDDNDGYGDPNTGRYACDVPEGWSASDTDCDDHSAETYPGATEICDEFDNDCNGEINDGLEGQGTRWFEDRDEDGWGNELVSVTQCTAPAGYVTRAGDCMDEEPTVHPDALEKSCDSIDQNCDGELDDLSRDPECDE